MSAVRKLYPDLTHVHKSEQDIFHKFLDLANALVVVLDENFCVTRINKNGCEILGLPKEKIMGRKWVESFISEKGRTALTEHFNKVIKGAVDIVRVYENSILNAKGTERIIDWRNSLIKNEDDGRISILSFGIDVTERKEAEEKLRASEEQYRALFEEGLTANYITSANGTFQMCNTTFAKILGYNSPTDLINKNASDFYVNPHDREYLLTLVKINKKVELFELQLKRKDNSVVWVLANNYGTFDKNGKLVYMNGYMFDISLRKKANLELLQTQAKLSAIIENSTDLIWSVDKDYKLVEFNYTYFKQKNYITGKQPYIGMQLNDRVGEIDLNKWQSYYERAFAGESFSIELEETVLKRKLYFDISFNPIKHGKEITGAAVIGRDITQRKKIEQQLNTKVNDLNTFMYKATHDLRAPLSSLLGIVSLAKNNIGGNEQKHYFEMIETSTKKMDKILLDLVDITKITKGDPVYEEIDFCNLVEEIIHSLNNTPGFENVVVKTEFSLNDIFLSDVRLLKSVFQNLIDNSFKYRNTQIKSQISIKIETNPSGAFIEVGDNGIGIQKIHLQSVFNMFFRASEQSRGTGLGLYIVKNSIEKLGGFVTIDSNHGKGTTVQFFIPGQKKN